MVLETPTVKSARRVLEILEYFSEGTKKAKVTEIAGALGYPQSSTSVLLASLERLGYLRFDESVRSYSPTLRVMLLGSRLQDELFSHGSLISEMEALRKRTKHTVMIGLRQGTHVRFILSLQGQHAGGIKYPVGVLRPVCRSAVGKILLSQLGNDRVVAIARHANAEGHPDDRVVVAELVREVEEIRRQGWALSVDYPLPGRATLAVALPQMEDQPAMAVTIGGYKKVMRQKFDFYLHELRAACAKLQGQRNADAQAHGASPRAQP